MKHRELTPEAISASTYRDSVHDAITAAIQTAYSQASKSGLMGAPGAEKIKKRFKEEFPAVLKNQLEQGVEPINLVMFSDATWEAAVSPHNQSLIISYKMTDMISDWVASAITYGAKTGAEIVSEVKKPVDYLSGVIVHEIVHLIQQQRQPGKRKDYHSLLKSSADRFISAVQNLASDEDWDLYHASPQEIPAYAHQMIYKMITQALHGEQLRDVPEDEIPYVIQELRDLLRDIATGVNASGDEIGRYLKFKGEDRRRVAVFKRFMKAVYVEVQSYISQLQAGYRGGRPVTESFDSAVEYEWESRSDYEGDAEFYVGDETYHYLYERDPKRESITISFGLGRYSDNLDYGSTGTGNQQIVFAAVIAITRDVLQSFPNTQKLKFSGENSRRQSLYSRIAKTLLLGWKVGRRGAEFTVTKPQEVKESFDSPVDYTWNKRDSSSGNADFSVGDLDYSYSYNYYDADHMLNIAFSQGGNMSITGRGNAHQIFSTVVAITRELLSEFPVEELVFSAEEPSRQKLYARLVKNLLPGWNVTRKDTYFFVTKPKQPVTETFDQPYPIRKKSQFDRVDYIWTGDDGRRGAAQFRLEDSDMNSWGLIFMVDDVSTGSGTIKQSGGGDAQRIFATVFACLRDWLANEGKDAYGLSFAAARDEPSRVKLYDRFARIMPRFGFEDTHSSFQPHHSKFYEFTRIGMEPPERHEPELIPPEEQIEEAAIYEVGFSHEVADIDNEQAVIDNSKIDGSISGKDVWRFHNANIDLTIYFFTDNQESIQAWVMLNGNNLMAMKSYSSGLNFALMHYIIDIKGIRLEIKATDTLTADGLKWILGQIARSDGFKITDQHSRPIDPDRLKKEWRRAQSQGPGPTAIWIGESAIANNLRLFEASPTHNDRFGIRQGKSEQIEETFDKPVKTKWIDFDSNGGFAVFETDTNKFNYSYVTKTDNAGVPIAMDIVFEDSLRGFGVTGGGDAYQVFATVVKLTREVLDKFSTISTITFNSAEPSRTKLYARMTKTLLPGWELLAKSVGKSTAFTLTRRESVTETFNSPVEAKWLTMGTGNGTANFTVGDVDYQYVYYVKQKSRDGKPLWVWVEFKTAGAKGKYGLTGTGNAAQVLATATQLTRELLDKFPSIYKLIFSAKEKSRQSLYAHMIRRLLPTWETDTKKDRNGLTFTVINNTALAESSLTEIERIPGQDFPIEKTQQILSHCTHDDGDSIDGLKLWMGRNGSERYVILTDDNRNIASYAGFHAIDSHRWQVRNAQTYPGFTGKKLAAKIYKELFGGGVSILSDFQQSSDAEHIWCKNLPAMGVTPMVWDSKSEEIYTADQIGMDKIYSQDPKIMHRYCWILEHHIPSQNLVYEGKMLMPIKGLWYTKRLRFDEMASAGATGSGSVATVAQPLGGVIRRPAIGSSILAGINTAEATPNTPAWMLAYKKKSQNKKRSK